MSHWRNIWTASRCGRKLRYSEQRAIKAAEEISLRSREHLIAYQCFDCGAWHVGHADGIQRKLLGQDWRSLPKAPKAPPYPVTGRCAAPDCGADIRGLMKMGTPMKYCSKACRRRAVRKRKSKSGQLGNEIANQQ